jgi:hypothetical protein
LLGIVPAVEDAFQVLPVVKITLYIEVIGAGQYKGPDADYYAE